MQRRMYETYRLKGLYTRHYIRIQGDNFVESLCGASAHRERVESPVFREHDKETLCPDCKLLASAESYTQRKRVELPPKELDA